MIVIFCCIYSLSQRKAFRDFLLKSLSNQLFESILGSKLYSCSASYILTSWQQT